MEATLGKDVIFDYESRKKRLDEFLDIDKRQAASPDYFWWTFAALFMSLFVPGLVWKLVQTIRNREAML